MKSKAASFGASLAIWLIFAAINFLTANIASYVGCRAAGVQPGGWEWQFIGAFLIGSIYGLLSFAIAYPIARGRDKDRITSGFIGLTVSTVSSFFVSWIGYLVAQ